MRTTLAQLFAVLTLSMCATAQTAWSVGDLFVAIGNGKYAVYHNSGTASAPKYQLSSTLTSDASGGQTGGCAFDSQFNLYATNFATDQVVEFNGASPQHPAVLTINTEMNSESAAFDASGNLYVGGTAATILKYHPSGPPQVDGGVQYLAGQAIATGSATDWIDLATDQRTVFFSGDGITINKSTLGSTQATSFAVPDQAFAVRLLSPFAATASMLVADTSAILRVSNSGAILQSYNTAHALKNWRFLALDPNGTSFWGGDWFTGTVARFNIVTGAAEVSLSTGAKKTLGGMCVKGGHQLNTVPLLFAAGTPSQNFAEFGAADSSSPNFHTWSATFDHVLTPILMVVSATEGVTLDRFDEYFCNQAQQSVSPLTPSTCPTVFSGTPTLTAIPYGSQVNAAGTSVSGNAVVYRVENPPPQSAYTGNLQVYVAYHQPAIYTPPACLSSIGNSNPRLMRDPDSSPPSDATANHSFAFDLTTFVSPFGKFGDPVSGGTKNVSDYMVADRCPLVNGTFVGSAATFNNPLPKQQVKSGSVIPIKIQVRDSAGNAVTSAVTFPNDITLSIAAPDGTFAKTFFSPGNSFSFFIVNGQSYAGNLDTTGLPLGTNSLCVTSIDKTQINNLVGTATGPGQFSPACVQINIVP